MPQSVEATPIRSAAATLVSLFPELSSVFDGATPSASIDPEQDRRLLFTCTHPAIATLGPAHPVLLILEDVHWSDEAT
jgi:predicted ATPase